MHVEALELPSDVINALKARGITELTPPQAEAVRRGLLKGASLVVVAPTASGKTLVGELSLINSWINGGKGVYVTPLKALAEEKFEEFRLWERLGVKVGITTGDYDEPGEELKRYDWIVATYERMDSIFRLKPSWLNNLQTIVIDELHMVGDEERGFIVELIAVRSLLSKLQLVGLSATVGKPQVLSEWLDSELVVSDWRPVKLIEGFYLSRKNVIVFSDGRLEEVHKKFTLPQHCYMKAVDENYQLLVFVQARRRAEEMSLKLATLNAENIPDARELVDELESSDAPRSEIESLSRVIVKGLAYHHAGLSLSSRRIVERGFRDRVLRAVIATPTLSAGINLPARRVLVYTRRFEGFIKPITVAEFKQMAGRAGRPQYDPYGEAIVADVTSEEEGWNYVLGKPEPVKSTLLQDRAVRINMLALIASGDARTPGDLISILGRTLAGFLLGSSTIIYAVSYGLKTLKEEKMIEDSGGLLRATKLGATVSRLYIDPLTAVIITNDLGKLVTARPLYYLTLIALTPDFSKVRVTNYRMFSEEARASLKMGLVPEPPGEIEEIGYYDWLRAYKVGRVLNAWIEEMPEDEIISRYGVGSGDLRVLVETGEWLTYAASRVCDVVGLKEHSKRLDLLSVRVGSGVKEELADLVRVKGVGRVRARSLFENGIKTVEDLASADPTRLANLRGFGHKVAREVVEEARKLIKFKNSAR
ncbi:MAG: DEAD/DEAH box helicase [Zestosphaera sp.]